MYTGPTRHSSVGPPGQISSANMQQTSSAVAHQPATSSQNTRRPSHQELIRALSTRSPSDPSTKYTNAKASRPPPSHRNTHTTRPRSPSGSRESRAPGTPNSSTPRDSDNEVQQVILVEQAIDIARQTEQWGFSGQPGQPSTASIKPTEEMKASGGDKPRSPVTPSVDALQRDISHVLATENGLKALQAVLDLEIISQKREETVAELTSALDEKAESLETISHWISYVEKYVNEKVSVLGENPHVVVPGARYELGHVTLPMRAILDGFDRMAEMASVQKKAIHSFEAEIKELEEKLAKRDEALNKLDEAHATLEETLETEREKGEKMGQELEMKQAYIRDLGQQLVDYESSHKELMEKQQQELNSAIFAEKENHAKTRARLQTATETADNWHRTVKQHEQTIEDFRYRTAKKEEDILRLQALHRPTKA
jgi:hypothetical protein